MNNLGVTQRFQTELRGFVDLEKQIGKLIYYFQHVREQTNGRNDRLYQRRLQHLFATMSQVRRADALLEVLRAQRSAFVSAGMQELLAPEAERSDPGLPSSLSALLSDLIQQFETQGQSIAPRALYCREY